MNVCPSCGFHHKLTCEERFKIFFDNKDFSVLKTPEPEDDPLKFPKYSAKLKQAREKTNQNDAVLIAEGKINGLSVTVGAQMFSLVGGAVGSEFWRSFYSWCSKCNNKSNSIYIF